jgi:uncharacterized protein
MDKEGEGTMNPLDIIRKYYDAESTAYYFLIHHSRLVTVKALEIAGKVKELNPDLSFIQEASMLHDIGIFLTSAPKIGCYGYREYICHGYLGRELVEKEGFPRHALVCERHVGVGVTAEEVRNSHLPLPERDMVPLSLEEKIICLADKFFSKSEHDLLHEKPLEKVRGMVADYGEDKLKLFDEWVKLFKV